MKRHFYINDDLDDLEAIENDLEASGVAMPQIHVLSDNDAGVETHHLHRVESILKLDVIHSTIIGFILGLVAASLVIGVAYFSGIPETITWVPPVFLAVVLLGFCTWEGGLMGIQKPSQEFLRFKGDLGEGKHVMFVDVSGEQEPILERIVNMHPGMHHAGTGHAAPWWFVFSRKQYERFIQWGP